MQTRSVTVDFIYEFYEVIFQSKLTNAEMFRKLNANTAISHDLEQNTET